MSTALIVLLLLVLLLGGAGIVVHALWFVLVVALVLWAVGFFVRGSEGSRRWYRW